jgi:hypothetical protein
MHAAWPLEVFMSVASGRVVSKETAAGIAGLIVTVSVADAAGEERQTRERRRRVGSQVTNIDGIEYPAPEDRRADWDLAGTTTRSIPTCTISTCTNWSAARVSWYV